MRIALVQSELAWGQVDKNLASFDNRLCSVLNCDVIVLPEMFTSGCVMMKKDYEIALAEKKAIAGRFTEVQNRMLEWAKRQNAAVMGSTVYEREGQWFNRMIVAFPDGKTLFYDKRHCFRMGGENEHFTGGEKRLVFEFRGVRIATFICYDLRFPVWCRNTDQYDVAIFSANWPESRREVWNTLLRARAIENQAFVVGVNCVGKDPAGLMYTGDSSVWDAKGNMVKAAEIYRDEIVTAECDIVGMRDFRRKFPVLEDRDIFVL